MDEKILADIEDTQPLSLLPEQVRFVVIKAKEFDVKEAVSDPDSGSNAADDGMTDVLEDTIDDPVVDELTAFINAMSEDQQIDLVALAWLGRGDYTAKDWLEVRAQAADAHNEHTATYLLGMPILGDYIEEGYSQLGFSCEEVDLGRL